MALLRRQLKFDTFNNITIRAYHALVKYNSEFCVCHDEQKLRKIIHSSQQTSNNNRVEVFKNYAKYIKSATWHSIFKQFKQYRFILPRSTFSKNYKRRYTFPVTKCYCYCKKQHKK